MASSRARQKNIPRRFFWMAVGIVAAIGLYTAGWHYAASHLLARAQDALAALNRAGDRVVCETPAVHGYPFRIGLYCDATYVERGAAGVTVSTGAFRSAAQVYQPRRIVAEADGPARVTLPGLMPLDIDWEALRGSARLARPLPEAVSLEARQVKAVADMPGPEEPLAFTADRLELHMRPNGAGLDAAVRFAALEPGRLLLGKGVVPPLSGVVDVTVEEGIARLRARRGDLRGLSVSVRHVEVRTPTGAALTAAGTISVGEDGLVDAALTLGAAKASELGPVLAAAFPAEAERIGAAFSGLAALGETPALPLTVTKGQVRLGFIPLGAIPPL